MLSTKTNWKIWGNIIKNNKLVPKKGGKKNLKTCMSNEKAIVR